LEKKQKGEEGPIATPKNFSPAKEFGRKEKGPTASIQAEVKRDAIPPLRPVNLKKGPLTTQKPRLF